MKFAPVKTAVIGCGMISNTYLRNLRDTFSIIDLVGCADMVDAKATAQSEKFGIRKMTVDEILSDPTIEMVVNITYASAHYEVSKAILSAGKHCYVEKMMALNLAQADELGEIARAKGVRFCAAPDTFLGASQQTSRWLIDRGIIGKPLSINVNLTRAYHMIKTDEDDAVRKYSVMREGGGIPYDMGGYYLHQIFNIFGPIDRVCGFCETHNPVRPYLNPRHTLFDEPFEVNTVNTITAAFKTVSGVPGTFHISSDNTTSHNIFTVSGTEGELELGDPNDFGDHIYLRKQGAERMEFPLAHPYRESSRGIGAADMAWGIRTNRPNRLSFEMGRHALEFIEAVRECTIDGQVKTLTTKFPRPAPISSEYFGGTTQERGLYLYENAD